MSWYARALASAFRDRLDHDATDMRQALAEAIAIVTESHRHRCDLESGSPSATVAAWRLRGRSVEYLVLCDASVVIVRNDGSVTEVTDDRVSRVTRPLIARELTEVRRLRGVVTTEDLRSARRAAVERTRNREGGFWCCQTDPAAAFEAITGRLDRRDVHAVIAASDGATRGHQILGVLSLADLASAAAADDAAHVFEVIRQAERDDAKLTAQAMKRHDDATLVTLVLDP